MRGAAIVAAIVDAMVASACAHPRAASVGPLDAASRALLLDPGAAYWSMPAPARYEARVETSRGAFAIAVDRSWAPRGADRFYRLARAGYYDDSRFTRVVPGFIAQFGIAGAPAIAERWAALAFPDDPVTHSNARGSVAFAMTGPNARTTQLFVSLADNARLDAEGFAPIGRVVRGMDVVDALYGGYGESAGGGVRAGHQRPLITGGNAYVDRAYPKLDRLIRVVVSDRR